MNWELLINSLVLSIAVAIAATALGAIAAIWVSAWGGCWRKIHIGAAIGALALPPFLVTNSWLQLLGYTGSWRGWFPLELYSLGGTVWVLTLMLWPIALLLVLTYWARIDQHTVEADMAVRGRHFVRGILLPMARPALWQSGCIIFVLALNNFSVPALLQTKVFPAELWVQFNTTFNFAKAGLLSIPLVAAPLLFLLVQRRKPAVWPQMKGPITPDLLRRQLGWPTVLTCGSGTLLLIAFSLFLPAGSLLFSAQTWTDFSPAFAAGKRAFANSIMYAGVASLIATGLGIVLWKWRAGWLFWLTFLVPGVVLGLGLIYLLNRPGLGWFYGSFGVVILALVVRYFALTWTTVRHAMQGIHEQLHDWAKLVGASVWRQFISIHAHYLLAPIAVGYYVVFLLCLWDVETLLLILPPGGETLSIRIFNLLHYGHNSQVNALCVILLGIAFMPLVIWELVKAIIQRFRRKGGMATIAVPLLCLLFFLPGCTKGTNEIGIPFDSQLFEAVQIIGSRGAGSGQFNKPRSLAVDSEDHLYVVDLTGRVQKFSPDGEYMSSWQMPETRKGRPKGMCRDGLGHIIVIEPHYSRINHFTPDGERVAQWEGHGFGNGELVFPRSAVVNSKGDLYVSEYGQFDRIQHFTELGREWLGTFGKAGRAPGEFNRPEGLGIDDQDRVYVADSCNHRIQVFTGDGEFIRMYGQAGDAPGQFSYPYDIRVDPAGRQYICEFGNSRIQILDSNDQLIEIVGGIGADPGQLSNPWAIALDSRGNLYVADAGNHRVQKFVRRKGTWPQEPMDSRRNKQSDPPVQLATVENLTFVVQPRRSQP